MAQVRSVGGRIAASRKGAAQRVVRFNRTAGCPSFMRLRQPVPHGSNDGRFCGVRASIDSGNGSAPGCGGPGEVKMREVLIGLIFLGIAIAIIVGVLWVSFSYLPEREHHNARPTPPAAIWSSGSTGLGGASRLLHLKSRRIALPKAQDYAKIGLRRRQSNQAPICPLLKR